MPTTTEKSAVDRAKAILHSVFGYPEFRPLQEICIQRAWEKRDTLLVMPTGAGKSLCYQIPALLFDGLTVVVSPLISLMQDQVRQLAALGVEAVALNSSLNYADYQRYKSEIRAGRIKILYAAPETLIKDDIQELLTSVRVDCLAVDEAHCISDWGHDFRPEYRKLAEVRSLLKDTAIIAMTATATPRVRQDIIKNLQLKNPQELIASFNRDNLFYEVIPKSNPFEQAVDFLKRFADQSGIIYCFSRKQVDELSEALNREGFSTRPYHAGLGDEERRTNQERFLRDDVSIMVATIAFGMGINKPNVRFVLHYDLPKNIESYYQETGRAGRDGEPSHCLLLFGYGDIQKIKFIISQKGNPIEQRAAQFHLNAMIHYAEAEQCRRIPLIRYFGEDYQKESCGLCDNCLNPKVASDDLTPAARQFLAAMLRTGQRFGAVHVIDVLRGSQNQRVMQYEHNELDVFGIGKAYSLRQWQFILRQLIQQEVIRREDDRFGVIKFLPPAFEILDGKRKVTGFAPPAQAATSKAPKRVAGVEPHEQDLFRKLRQLRKDLADRAGVPPYVIFPDKSLIDMSRQKPSTLDAFAGMYGVGEKKLKNYGKIFLEAIREHVQGK